MQKHKAKVKFRYRHDTIKHENNSCIHAKPSQSILKLNIVQLLYTRIFSLQLLFLYSSSLAAALWIFVLSVFESPLCMMFGYAIENYVLFVCLCLNECVCVLWASIIGHFTIPKPIEPYKSNQMKTLTYIFTVHHRCNVLLRFIEIQSFAPTTYIQTEMMNWLSFCLNTERKTEYGQLRVRTQRYVSQLLYGKCYSTMLVGQTNWIGE